MNTHYDVWCVSRDPGSFQNTSVCLQRKHSNWVFEVDSTPILRHTQVSISCFYLWKSIRLLVFIHPCLAPQTNPAQGNAKVQAEQADGGFCHRAMANNWRNCSCLNISIWRKVMFQKKGSANLAWHFILFISTSNPHHIHYIHYIRT